MMVFLLIFNSYILVLEKVLGYSGYIALNDTSIHRKMGGGKRNSVQGLFILLV